MTLKSELFTLELRAPIVTNDVGTFHFVNAGLSWAFSSCDRGRRERNIHIRLHKRLDEIPIGILERGLCNDG